MPSREEPLLVQFVHDHAGKNTVHLVRLDRGQCQLIPFVPHNILKLHVFSFKWDTLLSPVYLTAEFSV